MIDKRFLKFLFIYLLLIHYHNILNFNARLSYTIYIYIYTIYIYIYNPSRNRNDGHYCQTFLFYESLIGAVGMRTGIIGKDEIFFHTF